MSTVQMSFEEVIKLVIHRFELEKFELNGMGTMNSTAGRGSSEGGLIRS